MRRHTAAVLALVVAVLVGVRLVFLFVHPRIDPARPWHVELGRGSGMHGLNTIALDHTGALVAVRYKLGAGDVEWEAASARLSDNEVRQVLEAVGADGLLRLRPEYINNRICDGTQWVLWVRQDDWERAVYCSNEFPPGLTRFANRLTDLVARLDLRWADVPPKTRPRHDAALWESIRRR